MYSIFKKEFQTFFSNATGYVVISIFLLLTGLFLWVIPGDYNVFDSGYANLDGLFYLSPMLFLFLCPAITMRLFAEEKQTGTWELLITKPVGYWSILIGKFLAAWFLVVISLIPVILYFISVWNLAEPVGNIDAGGFWGSFIGLIFLAAVYVSVGTFSSSLSTNQIVSFIIAVVLSFSLFYGFDLLSTFFESGESRAMVTNFGILSHYTSISRGVIDSRDLVYFFVSSSLFLFLTFLSIRRN